MLTREQIDRYRVYDCGGDGQDCDCPLLRKILDQARQAIDLAAENERLKADITALTDVRRVADNLVEMERIKLQAENERLKAKLAEIKAECNKAMLVKNPLKHAGCLLLFGDKLNNILAIIDKDGE